MQSNLPRPPPFWATAALLAAASVPLVAFVIRHSVAILAAGIVLLVILAHINNLAN